MGSRFPEYGQGTRSRHDNKREMGRGINQTRAAASSSSVGRVAYYGARQGCERMRAPPPESSGRVCEQRKGPQ